MSRERATEAAVPKGSYAAGERVRIPAGAAPPYAVFVNGVEQREGEDYEVEDGAIHFGRPIVKEEIGASRWLAMYLGIFGTYRKDEKVDLHFYRNGRLEVAADLPVVPYAD